MVNPLMTLYSYCLRHDCGAAPNPYWGQCTLVICKPTIRRVAKCDDWIVGVGSTQSPIGDISKSVVYAMKVSKRLTIAKYDEFCQKHLSGKIPDWQSSDFRRRVGDCIYDYSVSDAPRLREGVHDEGNRQTDLGGQNALLSDHFYYFGDKPIPLLTELQPICHPSPGHKSLANAKYAEAFVSWLESLGHIPNKIYGEPQLKSEILGVQDCRGVCAARDKNEDERDEIC